MPLLILWLVAHFLVIRRLVDGKGLASAAYVLTMLVSGLWTSSVISNLLGVTL